MADRQDDDERQRANLAALAAAAIIVILTVFLLHLLSDNLKTERCLEERRHGCTAEP